MLKGENKKTPHNNKTGLSHLAASYISDWCRREATRSNTVEQSGWARGEMESSTSVHSWEDDRQDRVLELLRLSSHRNRPHFHTHIGESIKCALQSSTPPIRAMVFIKNISSTSTLQYCTIYTIGRDSREYKFDSACLITQWLVLTHNMNLLPRISIYIGWITTVDNWYRHKSPSPSM